MLTRVNRPVARFLPVALAVGVALAFWPAPAPAADEAAATDETMVVEIITPAEPAEPALEAVDRILTFSKPDRDALDVALSRRAEQVGTAFYMLLAKAAQLPSLAAEDFDSLPRPTYARLLDNPQKFAGQAIRLRVHVNVVQELVAGEPGQLGATPDWPQGSRVWRIDCFHDSGEYPGTQPMRVFSVVDPRPLLGRPREVIKGESIYDGPPPVVEMVGVFYKIWESEDRQTEQRTKGLAQEGAVPLQRNVRPYPLVVVWQIEPSGRRVVSSGSTLSKAGIALIMVVLLAAVFYLARRYARHARGFMAKGGAARSLPRGYAPLRDADSNDESDDESDDDEDVDDAIDPALKAAAEAYRLEHEQENRDA